MMETGDTRTMEKGVVEVYPGGGACFQEGMLLAWLHRWPRG